jgi:indole-3-acetate monooxygenase
VIELAPDKATAVGSVLAELASAQREVARADAELRAARLLLRDAADGVWSSAERGAVSFDDRGRLRSAMCHAGAVARRVVTAMYELGSSSSLYEGRLERVFRDTHAAAQHGLLNPIQLEPFGRHLLGVDPAVGLY